MNPFIKETLEKQLQILSERSNRERGEILLDLTRAMLDVATYLEKEPSQELKDVIADIVDEEMSAHGNYVLDSVTKACLETYGKESQKVIEKLNNNDELRTIIREEIDSYFESPANPLDNLVGNKVLLLLGKYDAALHAKNTPPSKEG